VYVVTWLLVAELTAVSVARLPSALYVNCVVRLVSSEGEQPPPELPDEELLLLLLVST
jgi:hypothetical protein